MTTLGDTGSNINAAPAATAADLLEQAAELRARAAMLQAVHVDCECAGEIEQCAVCHELHRRAAEFLRRAEVCEHEARRVPS